MFRAMDFAKHTDSVKLRHTVFQAYYANSSRPLQADAGNLNEVERFKNTKAIKEYISNQLKHDQESDQLSIFDPRDPFMGNE